MTNTKALLTMRRQHPRWFAALLLPVIAMALMLGASSLRADSSGTGETSPRPGTEYEPQEVVRIVVDSLASNAQQQNDAGIATVFRFASPGNRAATGPLPRFASMIKAAFPDMLDHDGARFDPMTVDGDTAVQAVWLLTESGKELGYGFQLSRQQAGEYEGMWMTDAVVPLGPGPASGTRI